MRSLALVALLAGVGCEKNLIAGLTDAPPARPDAMLGCPAPAQPLAAGFYKLYLNTEGVTLTAGRPDSRTNTTDLIGTNPTVVPPFLDLMTGRQAFIDQIVQNAQIALAPYSIDIVTTRPASGDYYMFVLGGEPPAPNVNSTSDFDCEVLSRDSVDLMFDHGMAGTYTPTQYAGDLLSDLGSLEGLAGTNANDDCECRIDACTWSAQLCTFGANVLTTTQVAPDGSPYNCGRTPTQNEPALLAAALGCR